MCQLSLQRLTQVMFYLNKLQTQQYSFWDNVDNNNFLNQTLNFEEVDQLVKNMEGDNYLPYVAYSPNAFSEQSDRDGIYLTRLDPTYEEFVDDIRNCSLDDLHDLFEEYSQIPDRRVFLIAFINRWNQVICKWINYNPNHRSDLISIAGSINHDNSDQ